MAIINMLSHADSKKGHGVLSAYEEQVALVKEGLAPQFEIRENSSGKSDILHIHTVNPSFYIKNKMKGAHCVSVGHVHFLPETLEKSLKLFPLTKQGFYKYIINFYKNCDHLVTVNPCYIPMLEAYGIEKEKVTYIPNFVADDKFCPIANKQQLRQKWKLKEKKFTVLGVGQLQHRKGVLDFAELAKALPEMQFIWAGGFSFGKMSSGYEEIKKLQKNPPTNLAFLGMVDRSVMNEVYNLADVLFQPSYEELFPMTILEAMCCELPLLLRDLSLYEGILGGYYLQGHDNEAFKGKLQALSRDEELRDYAKALSKKGHENYNKASVLAQWERFYKHLAGQAGSGVVHKKLSHRKQSAVLK